jgi:hypothetical protein
VLINHEDCKKYHALCALRSAFNLKPENISQRQYSDLHKVSAIVAKIVPRALTIKRYYAKFSNSEHTKVTFEEV